MAFSPANSLEIGTDEMMLAATILKSKFMYDFVGFKKMMATQHGTTEEATTLQMMNKLGQLLQHLTQPMPKTDLSFPRLILNVICTAVAYFSMHAHQFWPNLVPELMGMLS